MWLERTTADTRLALDLALMAESDTLSPGCRGVEGVEASVEASVEV